MVWSGYFVFGTGEQSPASYPNIRINEDESIEATVWQGSVAAGNLRFNIGISPRPGPGGPVLWNELPGTGRGVHRIITGTDPAAGANYILEIGSLYPNVVWYLKSVAALLTTDANAGNRYVSVAYEPEGAGTPTRWASWGSNRAVPANEAMKYFWFPGAHKDDLGTFIEHHQQGSLPMTTFPADGHRLIIFVADKKAGDTLTLIIIEVEEWVVPDTVGS